MIRFVLLPSLAFALVFGSTEAARAEVVVVQPNDQSSPVIVKTKPPTVVVVERQTVPQPQAQAPTPPKRDRKLGLHFDVGGTFGPQVLMGGLSGALRFRPKEHVAIDLGSGYFAGNDYQGFYRTEIPLTVKCAVLRQPAAQGASVLSSGPRRLVRACRHVRRAPSHDVHRRAGGHGPRAEARAGVCVERRRARRAPAPNRQRSSTRILRWHAKHRHVGWRGACLWCDFLFLNRSPAAMAGCCSDGCRKAS